MRERNFLDPINNADDLLYSVRSDLLDLARAFDLVGNAKLAERLRTLVGHIYNGQKLLQHGRDLALTGMVNAAEQSTANMVNAAIAVARSLTDKRANSTWRRR